MTNLKGGNATVRLANLTAMAKDFVGDLAALKADVHEVEVEIKAKLEAGRAELETLNVEIANRKTEHKQVLASLASLRSEIEREKDKVRKLFEGFDWRKQKESVA
jgi:chromosome segregation ATPase